MKAFTIFLIILAAVVGLLGFGAQTFLTQGLTSALNNTIFPIVQTEYGLEVSVENAAINLLKGQADLRGLAVQNLPGYEKPTLLEVERCQLKLEWLSLIKRKPIVLRQIKMIGIALEIERNAQRNINLQELAEIFQTLEKSSGPSLEDIAQDLPPAEKVPMAIAAAPTQFPVHIRRILLDGIVVYSDAKWTREFPLDLRLTGSDIFTVPAAGQPDSLLVLRGSLQGDQAAFTTDLSAIVQPLTDPTQPSFNATGSILNIDAAFLKELLEKNDMDSGPFSIRPSILCKQGVLNGSQVDFTLTRFSMYGAAVGDTSLSIPIRGTLQNPQYDISGALQSLFSKQSAKIIGAIGKRELQKRSDSTNAANQSLSELLMDELGKNIEEVEENKELQDSLKNLTDQLFGP